MLICNSAKQKGRHECRPLCCLTAAGQLAFMRTTAPAEPAAPPSSSATAPNQATGPTAPNESRNSISTPAAANMPPEDRMSVANRHQVQEALHRLGYYDGPVDGIFGPLTRGAIRRFQESIGEKSTGRLTAAEASRLVS
jgi:peptidoglycan hydrolase-like protein with peptidoglycan-binding domain